MMIYLASPYSHSDHKVRQERFKAVQEFLAHKLPRTHMPIFSPILYAHEMAEKFSLGTDHQTWMRFNTGMLRIAHEMWVLKLDGWEDSLGVKHEIAFQLMCKIPVRYFAEDGVEFL